MQSPKKTDAIPNILALFYNSPIELHNSVKCLGITIDCRLNFQDHIGLGPHLFVKMPRPGDSEMTFAVFESSCHLLLPV